MKVNDKATCTGTCHLAHMCHPDGPIALLLPNQHSFTREFWCHAQVRLTWSLQPALPSCHLGERRPTGSSWALQHFQPLLWTYLSSEWFQKFLWFEV